MTTPNRLWIDLETTGLEPCTCGILEIAVGLERMDGIGLQVESWIVFPEARRWEEAAVEMHVKNGLLQAALIEGVTQGQLWNMYVHPWLEEMVDSGTVRFSLDQKFTLAGSSVHFDREFLRMCDPGFFDRTSHRLFDVGALKLFAEDLGIPGPEKRESIHRAKVDVLNSYADFLHYRELFRMRGVAVGVYANATRGPK